MLRRDALVGGAALSLGIHGLVAWMLVALPSADELAAREATPLDGVVPFEARGMEEGTPGAARRGNAPTDADRAVPGGTRSAQNIDATDRGEGGDVLGAADAILLMHRADGVLLFDSPLNNVAAAQSQRIRTARDRATLERRRATPNPNDDVFLASGPGAHQERRPVSAIDSATGARVAPTASVAGAAPSEARPGSSASPDRASGAEPGSAGATRASAASAEERGTEQASPGRGILGGEGTQRSEAARVATARPSVDEGPAATQAEAESSRVRDQSDAELLARSMEQSWVEATARRGPRDGAGAGGVGGGGAPGSGGGRREGGRAAAYGPGDGDYDALDTSDPRYRRWFVGLRRRVYDALRFPRERALAMDQGVSVYRIVVRRDGTLVGEPEPLRPSGFPDIDQAALAAIHAAAPFAPLPDDIAPGQPQIRVRLPIELSNPMVR